MYIYIYKFIYVYIYIFIHVYTYIYMFTVGEVVDVATFLGSELQEYSEEVLTLIPGTYKYENDFIHEYTYTFIKYTCMYIFFETILIYTNTYFYTHKLIHIYLYI
jgi:hypothetical protein